MAGEGVADDELLHREGGGDVAGGKRAHDRVGDAEIGKRSDVVCSFSSLLGEIQRPLSAISTRRKRNLSAGENAEPTHSP